MPMRNQQDQKDNGVWASSSVCVQVVTAKTSLALLAGRRGSWRRQASKQSLLCALSCLTHTHLHTILLCSDLGITRIWCRDQGFFAFAWQCCLTCTTAERVPRGGLLLVAQVNIPSLTASPTPRRTHNPTTGKAMHMRRKSTATTKLSVSTDGSIPAGTG